VAAPARTQTGFRLQRNGWTILRYPGMRAELLALRERVLRARTRDPSGWQANGHAKLLKRLLEIMLAEIPADPASPAFEQGNTIGKDARGWRRAKFLGRFRLFFRFDSRSQVIIYAWVNDEGTLRARGSESDPYTVFRRMLLAGDPPHGWADLLAASLEPIRTGEDQALRDLLAVRESEAATPPASKPGPTRRRPQ